MFSRSFSLDLRERHTLLTQSLGVAVQVLPLVAVNQTIIQRYVCIRDKCHAKM